MQSSPEPAKSESSLVARARQSAAWALLVGGLLVGGVVSLLHLLLNEVSSGLVAVASWLWFLVLNGLFAGVVTLSALVALPLLRWVTAKPPLNAVPALQRLLRTESAGELGGATLFGLRVFAVIYALFGVLYGLTYDQTVLYHPRGWVGMVVYLLVLGALIAALSWWAARVLLASAGEAGFKRSAVTILLVLGLGHAGVAAKNWSSAEGDVPLRNASGVEVVPAAEDDSGPAASTPAKHVVLMGFDGLDPRVLDRLIDEGRLPNFARLRQAGASAPLRTLPHANSAVIWSSIYTGYAPHDHGIHDFYRVRMAGLGRGFFPVHRSWFIEMVDVLSRVGLARQVPVLRGDLRRFPLWEIVDHFGVSAGVVDGYLNSYPAVSLDSEDSYMIAYGADLFTEELEAGRMEIQDIGSFIQPVDLLERDQYPRGRDFEWQTKLAFELLESRAQPRLMNLYWHQPDAVQHSRWSEFEPWRYPFAKAPEELEIIEQHEEFDAFLGRIEQAVEPGTVFVLVSDHGHAASIVHAMDTQHRHGPDGVMMIWGAGVNAGAALDAPHVYDVVPTVLALLGLPVAQDMPGRVLGEIFEGGLADLAARTVTTYEGLWRAPAVGKDRDPRLIQAEIDRLKSMGYL